MHLKDRYNAASVGRDNTARYELWEAIADILPETREGNWTLEFPTPITLDVVERL